MRLTVTGKATGTNNITVRKENGSGELIATIPASDNYTDVEVERGQVCYLQMNSDEGAAAIRWTVNGQDAGMSTDVLTYTANANAQIELEAAIV